MRVGLGLSVTRLAHARDPRARRGRHRRRRACCRPTSSSASARRRGDLDRRDRRLDAVRRGPAAPAPRAAATASHDHEPRATTTTTPTRTATTIRTSTAHDAELPRATAASRHSHLPPAGVDDHLAQPVRPRPRRRPDPLDERAADPARLDRRRAAPPSASSSSSPSGSAWRLVMGGIGLALVFARGRLERVRRRRRALGRVQHASSRSRRRSSCSASGST